MLNGRIKAMWQAGQSPLVDAVLYSDDGTIGLTQEETGYIEMPYQRASVIAKSVDNGLKVRTDILGNGRSWLCRCNHQPQANRQAHFWCACYE